MKKSFLAKLFLLTIIFFSFNLYLANQAKALTVISPVLEINTQAGENQRGVLKVYNETETEVNLVASVEPFKASNDETGKPEYLSPSQSADFSYLQWFKLAQNAITLKPAQAAKIPFVIDIPPEAKSGGYYAVVFWQNAPVPGQEKSMVNISGRVGTIILLRVAGNLQESGEVLDFTPQPLKDYYFELPINFVIRFSNTGNVHLAPQGEISIKNWFGQVTKLDINPGSHNVLPDSIRRFEVSWGQKPISNNFFSNFLFELKQEFKNFPLGRCQASLDLSYGFETQQKINWEISFWVIHWRLLVVVFLFLVILFLLIRINSKIKRLKRLGVK